MYCNAIAQSYHSENAIIKILDTTPEPLRDHQVELQRAPDAQECECTIPSLNKGACARLHFQNRR
jgi:hypothetical protein